uniref:Uncharacterized protein LOC102809424 n=1 Tax=Saccoglossus kowalevskii TaxID=10224 RepID=A0ABM0MPL1_SACKO|nr:PREDICTED: uncharacterized protein LOC102809424 [Saccoglossus kowalevskii]
MASPSIDVYVKLSTGRVVTFDLMPDQNVEEIYRKVAKEEDVFENQIVLRYTGKVVKKSHTIGYLGICRETILKSEIIELKVINIFVKQAGGDIVELTLNNLTTLSQVKKRIHDKQDIPTSTQILKLAKTVLSPDSESLLNLGVKDEDVLTLVIKKDENHQMEEEIEIEEDIKQELLNNFAADLPCNKVVEVVFSFDTTGSMYSCLQKVRDKLGETVTRLLKDIPKIRIGIMAHGDYCDDNVYVVKTIDLCSNVHKLVKFVVGVDATSGGDSPECYEWVLRRAQMLDWSEDSAKALVVIGDDLPHPVSYTDQAINWHDELDVLKGMGIKVYGVKANNNNYATPFYKELAEITDGAYIQFKHFSLITDMFLAAPFLGHALSDYSSSIQR